MSVHLLGSSFQPFLTTDQDPEKGTVLVKGLFTTDNLDRERDFVDPMQFNLDVFNTTGTLLRNHEFIKDLAGNKEPAGKVLKTIPVIISQENPENQSEWVLKSLLSGDFVTLWPKEQSPNLLVGDRAVYIVAEVTHPEVVKQVLNKELRAFSWKGLSIPVERENGVTELTKVDLLEVSLVNIPANPDATFVLTDENDPTVHMEVSLKDCNIYQIGFDKTKYSLETIKEYTKNYTDTSIISENSDNYFVQIGEPNLVDVANSFVLNVGTKFLVAAPKIEEKKKTVPIVANLNTHIISENIMSNDVIKEGTEDIAKTADAEKFYLLDIEALKSRMPDAVVSLQKSTVINDHPVDFLFVEFPAEIKAIEKSEEPKTEEVVETPSNEGSEDKLDKLTSVVESLVATMAAKAQEEVEAEAARVAKSAEAAEIEKSAEDIKEELRVEFEAKLEAFKAQEAQMEVQRETLQKSLAKIAAFETAVPPKTEREEKITNLKSTDTPEEISSVDYFATRIMKGI